MRDFRDAKAMAHALRAALKCRAVETTHSESLELIAKAFGYENWNILAAKIEAATPHAAPPVAGDSAAEKTLFCSFCGKSQHDVKKLIAGPSVYICDACVHLCTEVVRDEDPFWRVLSLLATAEASGEDPHPAALDHIRGRSTEHVASFVERCGRFAEHNRLLLQYIRRRLVMRPEEAPAPDDRLTSQSFVHLNKKSKPELRAMQQETQRALKRGEDALRIGTIVLGEREQQGSA